MRSFIMSGFYGIVFGLFLLAGYKMTHETVCQNVSLIHEVGGCDSTGYCSYSTISGDFGTKRFPVKGQTVCVKEVVK